ncbi:hypothetical protein IJ425_01100 [bacterium]|nr:hypothetical protein [bacterium]
MDFLSSISQILGKKDKSLSKEILDDREEMIAKFRIQLREQYFMSDEEIKEVIEVVEKNLQGIDEFQKNFDYSDYDFNKNNEFESKLIRLRNNLNQETKAKINEIMKTKLAKAKEYFGKES